MITIDATATRKWAAFYRSRGLNPLPSRMDAKRPMVRFADYWDNPFPVAQFDRQRTTNIQVMTGRHWRLLVIDLDGAAAWDEWRRWGSYAPTWMTHSGGDGRHLWFRLPADYPDPLPKATLWQGDGKHIAIERLCDKSLIVAPPSIHPETGQRYTFFNQYCSPKKIPMPAICPAWVLGLRPVEEASPKASIGSFLLPARVATHSTFGRTEVLDAIPDKIGLARSWGVRIAGGTGQSGWTPCHAIDREDIKPSAAIHYRTGYYVDRGSGSKLSLFDLGIKLGVYQDFHHAISDLGARYA